MQKCFFNNKKKKIPVLYISPNQHHHLCQIDTLLCQKSKSQALTNDMAFTLRHCLGRFGDNRAVNQAKKGCSRICFAKLKRMKMLADEGLNGGLN